MAREDPLSDRRASEAGVALITGASSGLGRRFAEVLAANGAAVALVARRASKLNEIKAAIEKAGGTLTDEQQRLRELWLTSPKR